MCVQNNRMCRKYKLHVCVVYRGVKATDKREGRGAYNWGTMQDEIE